MENIIEDIDNMVRKYKTNAAMVSKERLFELLMEARRHIHGNKRYYRRNIYHECINRMCVSNENNNTPTRKTACFRYRTEKTLMRCLDKVTVRREKL